LLLTTVSTQSIVILFNTVFKQVPVAFNITLILLGIGFYVLSAFYILKRYYSYSWSVETDWSNTNCILHGALSITGIACITSELLSKNVVTGIWVSTALVFLVVEAIEIYRVIRRIKAFGLKEAFLIYDVSQWSRIFTFSMFYTFTFLVKLQLAILLPIKEAILLTGVWLVLTLVLFEIFILTGTMIGKNRSSSEGKNSSPNVNHHYA
jgi:hypothetical protein